MGAVVAVNAFGDVVGDDRGTALTGPLGAEQPSLGENTTIGVVATNAALDKVGCLLVAQSAHDGLARALDPVHTTVDGDAVVAAATASVAAPVDDVRVLAAQVVETAVRAAVAPSSPSSLPESG